MCVMKKKGAVKEESFKRLGRAAFNFVIRKALAC